MTWTARCEPATPAIVVITYSGAVSSTELRDATKTAVALARERHATRYLVDATAVVRLPHETGLHFLPASMYDELGLDRRETRVAVVVSASDEIHQLGRFYESACLNRGWQVKLAATVPEAIAWLGPPAAGAG